MENGLSENSFIVTNILFVVISLSVPFKVLDYIKYDAILKLDLIDRNV